MEGIGILMTSLLDQYLLFRMKTRGDKEAFARLYDRYVLAIYRFVFLKLPSKELAEDVTSETFLKAWRFIQQNKEISNFRALLYQIARNSIVDFYRKKSEQHLPMPDVTFADVETSFYSEEGDWSDVSDRERGRAVMEARADLTLIIEWISRLKEDYQDVLTLRLIDGLPFGDIAKILEKTSGHVRVMYHRALKALDQVSKDTHHEPSVGTKIKEHPNSEAPPATGRGVGSRNA